MSWLVAALLSVAVIAVAMTCVAYLTWIERKIAARFQNRIGPYWVGYPHGWLQPLADVAKLIVKEDITPRRADRVLFNLAPMLDRAAARIDREFRDRPEIEASLRQELGTTFLNNGMLEKAEAQLTRRVAARACRPSRLQMVNTWVSMSFIFVIVSLSAGTTRPPRPCRPACAPSGCLLSRRSTRSDPRLHAQTCQGARRSRPDEHPVRDQGRCAVRARGQPARQPDGTLRGQGDGRSGRARADRPSLRE